MSYSSSKQVSHMASLYESIYHKHNFNSELKLCIELYNIFLEKGLIEGDFISEEELHENVANTPKLVSGIQKGINFLSKVSGFGRGPGVGGKRKALTVGTATATAIDPQKAAQQVGGAVTGTATAINRAGRAAMGQAVPAANSRYQYNSFDVFDAIKGHLLDEGYADTEDAALAIMANMSEEWRRSIVEQNAIVTTGTSTNASGEKIPWTHRAEPSGRRTVEDKFGKRELREPRLKGV